jgi:hypothetical protein
VVNIKPLKSVNKRQCGQPEDFEVDPDILWQPEGDVDIGGPQRMKNTAQAIFSRDQTSCGSVSSLPNIRWINGFFMTHWLISSARKHRA